jgi:hypothetical protein
MEEEDFFANSGARSYLRMTVVVGAARGVKRETEQQHVMGQKPFGGGEEEEISPLVY